MRMAACVTAAACGWLWSPVASPALITIFSSAGDLATVFATRDAFRVAIGGGTTPGANGSFGGVRREINWDGVPDSRADPNLLPDDFFNVNSPRGVVFDTPGTGFMVSANGGQAVPIQFGFADQLEPFSSQRLFTALNSPVTDVNFFVAGTSQAATTSAFGVIFSDVDVPDITRIDFFDVGDQLLFSGFVLPSGGNELFSFLGITVDDSLISRVRITSGSATIVSNGVLGVAGDLVAMDDFLFAEPVAAVPEPATLALVLAAGLLVVSSRYRLTHGSPV
jgi:hypothetical protein